MSASIHGLSLNAEFGAALLEPAAKLPEGVTGPRGKKAEKRFAVYRNNVIVSLINALADIFPGLRNLVGEKAFGDIARTFIADHPPESPLLFEYGDKFPEFLSGFKPLSAYPFLPDLARLEHAWLQSFHAADDSTIDPQAFVAVPTESLGDLTFTPHPATRLIESQFAIVSLMTRSRNDEPLEDIKPRSGETALITRPGNNVEVRALPPGGGAFFGKLIEGASLARAAEAAADATAGADPQFDLAAGITALMQSGAFTEVRSGPQDMPLGDAS